MQNTYPLRVSIKDLFARHVGEVMEGDHWSRLKRALKEVSRLGVVMRSLLLITAAAMAVAGSANAQNWAFVVEGDDAVTGMDFDSIRTVGNRRIFWNVRAHASTRGSEPGDMGDYVVTRSEYDCVEERWRPLAFNVLLFDGTSLGALETPARWAAVFPDTVASEMMGVVCGPTPARPNGWETAKEFAQNVRRVYEETAVATSD